MEIQYNDKYCVITPLSSVLNKNQCDRLYCEIKSNIGFQIGLDLSFVNDCTEDFIEMLKSFRNLNVFNIPSDIFVLFNTMKMDKCLNLYASEEDFTENSHRLINRSFKVL